MTSDPLAERAARAELALPRRRLHVAMQQEAFVHLLKQNAQASFELSEHTRAVINGLLADVNMASTVPWLYVSLAFFERDSDRRARGPCFVSAEHLEFGPGSIGYAELDMPYPWTDQQREYRLDVFGHQLLPHEDARQYPDNAVWTIEFGDDVATRVVAWRCRAFRPGASTFAQTDWRPGWDRVVPFWGGDLDPGVFPESAAIDQTLLRDIQKRGAGAPRKAREKKLDKLAKEGLRWWREHPGHDIEDVGREQLAEATHRVPKTLEEYMRINRFRNEDVHERMRKLLNEGHGQNSSGR